MRSLRSGPAGNGWIQPNIPSDVLQPFALIIKAKDQLTIRRRQVLHRPPKSLRKHPPLQLILQRAAALPPSLIQRQGSRRRSPQALLLLMIFIEGSCVR